jgi:PilZ domain
MKPERRCISRERPKELSYIQLEPEGGGIVVNASEQGLAFHAAAALRQTGPIQICVSPNPLEQIKLTAEIAWMDETKKSGGLRITELTADTREIKFCNG